MQLTDHDWQKSKGSLYQDGYSAIVAASDGFGNATSLNVYPALKGAIRTSWSEDFFQNWHEFYVGTPPTAERLGAFYACLDSNSGDDSRDAFIRLVNRHGRCLDVHFYFTPDASPKIAAYVQQDDGLFDRVWTLG